MRDVIRTVMLALAFVAFAVPAANARAPDTEASEPAFIPAELPAVNIGDAEPALNTSNERTPANAVPNMTNHVAHVWTNQIGAHRPGYRDLRRRSSDASAGNRYECQPRTMRRVFALHGRCTASRSAV